jgi:uncharacterized protein with HEPN domain
LQGGFRLTNGTPLEGKLITVMERLLESFKTMLHLLTGVRLIIHSVEKINETRPIFRQVIQFDGYFAKFHSDAMITATLLNHALLLCCSILDEFNTEFVANKHSEFADRITLFRQQIKPVTRRINKWKGLKDYRNQIVAHNLRINGRSIFGKADKSLEYKVPTTVSEIKLLSEFLALITQNIGIEFPELVEQMKWSETIDDKIKIEYPTIDYDTEFEVVAAEIKKLGLTKTQQTDLSS